MSSIFNHTKLNPLKINAFLLQLMAFVLPLSKRLMPVLIILWVVNSLFFIGLNKKRLVKQAKPSMLILLYVLYVVWFFISPYKDSAMFDLEVKLSLLLFPLGFYFTGNYLPKRNQIFKSFIYGITVGLTGLIFRALYYYIAQNETLYFTYSEFSLYMHTSYYAMYVCWALFLLISNYFSSNVKRFFSSGIIYLFLGLLFSGAIFLLASKTGIIAWVLLMLYAVVLYYLNTRKIIPIIALFSTLALMFVALVNVNNKLLLRFREAYHVLVADDSGKAFSSTTARAKIWPLAWELIKKNPVGYGTGAEKETLKAKYLANGMTVAYEKGLNAHNQFLQTGLALGWLGLLLLIVLFSRFIYLGYKYDEWFLFGFAIITIINFITESMLETQAGVIFFAFFYSLLDAYFMRDYSHLQKKTVFLRR
ncbi:MAG TPA: hypothetical protein DIU39_00470 [Flavobacteriales bacterium]|nr:hypothetical protein [Flavobacteriales bacterium]|tara:strand:+ start:3677 stop:4936 length:1260 start_codon:yes stop_codon:yes gene_type:complete